MANLWIVVADAMEARMYAKREEELEVHPVRRLENPALRIYRPREEAGAYWIQRFAREISAVLEYGAMCGEYDEVILTAPEPFLGQLLNVLGPATQKRLRQAVNEKITGLDGCDLEARLTKLVYPPDSSTN
jgi:hypothetical protein